MWPAFWMLPSNEESVWPQDGEIDIMENVGKEPGIFHGTIHYADKTGGHMYSGTSTRLLLQDVHTNEFHTFSIEKQPGKLTWMIDGYVYFERSKDDMVEKWPFDDNKFHLLLNLAVGGDWPGNPDETTVYPQRMIVDYVRYYDKLPFGKLVGPTIVVNNQKNVAYTLVHELEGHVVEWMELPPGSDFVDNRNDFNTVFLDFDGAASSSGYIVLQVTNPDSKDCVAASYPQSEEFRLGVTVVRYVFSFVGIKVDDSDTAVVTSASGVFDIVDNPDMTSKGSINTSPSCIMYTRDSKSVYDTVTIQPVEILDAMVYVNGTLHFAIDIYTKVDHSYDVMLQLEDSTITENADFPTGIHSRFILHVEQTAPKETSWQRYYFNFFDQLDVQSITTIDTIILLFQPNTNSGDIFHFGNLDTYATISNAPHNPNQNPSNNNMEPLIPSVNAITTQQSTEETTQVLVVSSFLIAAFAVIALISYCYKQSSSSKRNSTALRNNIAWDQFYLDPITHEEIDDVNLDDITGMEIVGNDGFSRRSFT